MCESSYIDTLGSEASGEFCFLRDPMIPDKQWSLRLGTMSQFGDRRICKCSIWVNTPVPTTQDLWKTYDSTLLSYFQQITNVDLTTIADATPTEGKLCQGFKFFIRIKDLE